MSAMNRLSHLLAGGAPLIMGILNVTPDSFSDGGLALAPDDAFGRAEILLAGGADVLDVGGESTRPGAEPVDAAEQIRRVVPVIAAIRRRWPDACLSVDTTRSAVAGAALEAGADFVNDVSAGRDDGGMFDLVARKDVPIVLMHMQGAPPTMQDAPSYVDVVHEVVTFLEARVCAARAAGIAPERIVLDPGIGFGKRREDNLALIAHLDRLVALGFPVLLGASRKRFMGAVCAETDPRALIPATVATTALGVWAGVRLFRVHDVPENLQAARMAFAARAARNF